jgi:hypothetical protein
MCIYMYIYICTMISQVQHIVVIVQLFVDNVNRRCTRRASILTCTCTWWTCAHHFSHLRNTPCACIILRARARGSVFPYKSQPKSENNYLRVHFCSRAIITRLCVRLNEVGYDTTRRAIATQRACS